MRIAVAESDHLYQDALVSLIRENRPGCGVEGWAPASYASPDDVPALLIGSHDGVFEHSLYCLGRLTRWGMKCLLLTSDTLVVEAHELFKRELVQGIVKTEEPSCALFDAIDVVTGGATYISPATEACLAAQTGTLTSRERTVLRYVVEGYNSSEISARMCITEKTVEKHRANIRRKNNLKTVAHMVSFAYERGLVKVQRRFEPDLDVLPDLRVDTPLKNRSM